MEAMSRDAISTFSGPACGDEAMGPESSALGSMSESLGRGQTILLPSRVDVETGRLDRVGRRLDPCCAEYPRGRCRS